MQEGGQGRLPHLPPRGAGRHPPGLKDGEHVPLASIGQVHEAGLRAVRQVVQVLEDLDDRCEYGWFTSLTWRTSDRSVNCLRRAWSRVHTTLRRVRHVLGAVHGNQGTFVVLCMSSFHTFSLTLLAHRMRRAGLWTR